MPVPLARRSFVRLATLVLLAAGLAACGETTVEAPGAVSTSAVQVIDGLAATLEPGEATFTFDHTVAGRFEIDLSTDMNMATDVYVAFGAGTGSPVTVLDPHKWDKYVCERTLYWRVRDIDAVAVSPIASAVVCPPNPFTDLAAALNTRQANFVFEHDGASDGFTVHASTSPDLSGTVWTTSGTTSPVRLRVPADTWPDYGCGFILYWRVENDLGVSSPIQEKHVCGSVGFSAEEASFSADEATFAFRYRGVADHFRVDVSTAPDMKRDVFVGFGTGSSSPIVVANPGWDKYVCGATLHWRVRELLNGAEGEIHTTTVECGVAP
jgi:hypothetical protein